MAQLLSQIRYWTQYLVGDPQLSTYSLQMYTDATDFAMKDYAAKTGATYSETASIPDSGGFIALPLDYIRPIRVYYSVGGTTQTELIESTFSFEDLKSNVWQNLTQTAATFPPRRWAQWSGAKIRLTPIPTSTAYLATIGYVQKPASISETPTTAGSFVYGKSYQIATIGGTDFTLVGATASTIGVNFIATGVGTGAGTVMDVVDLRIPESHNEYLKYAAASWLLQLDGDGQDLKTADGHMQKFNSLIGYSDPVLEAKMKLSRTQPEREM